MEVSRNQVFNLMDTNGRRNDVINALQGYLMILDNLLNEKNLSWENFPKSSAQFQFYKQAIETYGKENVEISGSLSKFYI